MKEGEEDLSSLYTLSQVASQLSQEKEVTNNSTSNSEISRTSTTEKEWGEQDDTDSSILSSDDFPSMISKRVSHNEDSVELARLLLNLKKGKHRSQLRMLLEKGKKLQWIEAKSQYNFALGDYSNLGTYQENHGTKMRKSSQGRPTSGFMKIRLCYFATLDELRTYLSKAARIKLRQDIPNDRNEVVAASHIIKIRPAFFEVLIDDMTLDRPEFLCSLQKKFRAPGLNFVRVRKCEQGKTFKTDIVQPPESGITVSWIKKQVCFPRYKSNMKLYLVGQ